MLIEKQANNIEENIIKINKRKIKKENFSLSFPYTWKLYFINLWHEEYIPSLAFCKEWAHTSPFNIKLRLKFPPAWKVQFKLWLAKTKLFKTI